MAVAVVSMGAALLVPSAFRADLDGAAPAPSTAAPLPLVLPAGD